MLQRLHEEQDDSNIYIHIYKYKARQREGEREERKRVEEREREYVSSVARSVLLSMNMSAFTNWPIRPRHQGY